MKIEVDKIASIHYTLKNEQGELLDSSQGQAPLSYLHGKKSIIPGLEKALEGKAAGESFDAVVPPEDGYGPHNDQLINDVPIEKFNSPEELKAGSHLQVQSQQGVQIVTVVEVGEASIKVDFNHPLAGKTLHFEVEIVEVRPATPEELEHGHAHGAGGHEH